MGASAREIERQIKETRERMDQNITRLEETAATGVVRYGRWAAIGLGVMVVAGVALVVYRLRRQPTPREKADRRPGTVGRIVREMAPAVIGTVSTAVLQRSARSPEPRSR